MNEKFLNELEEKLHFKSDKRIKFVGTVYDQELLKKIRENAYAYFHGHTVGGTNPSLIEALGSTDLNLLVDVGFNKEVAEDCALYWSRKPGSLAKLIDKADQMSTDEIAEMGQKAKQRVAEEYTWDKICRQYENVFVGKQTMGDTRKYRNIDALRTFGCLAIIAWHVKANTGFSTGGTRQGYTIL